MARPTQAPGGLRRQAVMRCDRSACLSAFPRQRAAKSNASSQAARRAFCPIQFPLLHHSKAARPPGSSPCSVAPTDRNALLKSQRIYPACTPTHTDTHEASHWEPWVCAPGLDLRSRATGRSLSCFRPPCGPASLSGP